MAKNKPYKDNARKGAVKKRSQVYNKKIKRYVKRSTKDGKFVDVKSNTRMFKGVRRER